MTIPLKMMETHLQMEIQLLLQHPFLMALTNATLSEKQLYQFATQYGFYQDVFPRCLAAAVSKIPNDETRLPVVKYLWEEHGEGDLSKCRKALYTLFLHHLSQTQGSDTSEQLAPTAKYINTLLELYVNADFLEALGALGLGSELFIGQESSLILSGLQQYDLPEDALLYWRTREPLANKYYATIFATLEPWAESDTNRGLILAAARRSVQARRAFWEGLAKAISPDDTAYIYETDQDT